MAKKIKEVHPAIRKRLGYAADEPVDEVLRDWKQRTSTVCKPCWELKYCPYGPLVEQLPLLPTPLAEVEKHNSYLKGCLETGMIGEERELDEFSRDRLSRILKDDDFASDCAVAEVRNELAFESIKDSDDPIRDLAGGPLPPLEEYRVPFEVEFGSGLSDEAPPELRARVEARRLELIEHAKEALASGREDNRKPLDPARRKMFELDLARFNSDDHPPQIPEIFEEASCNVFGHICPVFFAAEAITETSELRRRSRYISFKTKMRVVRRDNHTCQECSVHLRDDEVEFDHIIPVAKGGSSEEHNIRLTCFDCNRDKSSRVRI